jgi:hypothetical protein
MNPKYFIWLCAGLQSNPSHDEALEESLLSVRRVRWGTPHIGRRVKGRSSRASNITDD